MPSHRNSTPSENPTQHLSRRTVLAAGLAIPTIVPAHVLGGAGRQAPSDKLRIVAVGPGGMGRSYLGGCRAEEIVALADVDHNFAGAAFNTYPKARRYHDFRKMFEVEADNFDAVIIATPDHTHTVVMMAALAMDKHVYCAKPVTHTIGEARRVRAALARKPDLVTKTSVQSSATEAACGTTELLESGVLGSIRTVHIWCDHPKYPCLLARPKDTQTPPPGMRWDLWIGPAPTRPYHSTYHPGNWRPWWDFGSGTVGDMACHSLHAYFKTLRLSAPHTIYSRSTHQFNGYFNGRVSNLECQGNANTVTWEFGERGDLPPVKVHWYDGGMKPHRPKELADDLVLPNMGVLFEGDQGKLVTGYGGGNPFKGRGLAGGLLLSEKKFNDFQQPARSLRRCEGRDHYTEWTRMCKSGGRTSCPLEFGAEMTELALLGALSLRTRRMIKWDAKKVKVINSDQADKFVDPPYENAWTT